MPNFHFQVNGPAVSADASTIVFSDLAEAQMEALKLAGTLIADASETFWDKPEWMLIVTDDEGLTLFQLQVLGKEGPAAENLSRVGFGEGTYDGVKTSNRADVGVDGS